MGARVNWQLGGHGRASGCARYMIDTRPAPNAVTMRV